MSEISNRDASTNQANAVLLQQYLAIRNATELICKPLATEDYVLQPAEFVSPPKWHLGHTTWFFETFILQQFQQNYRVYNNDFNYVFNSYYETVGARVIRTDRGNLSRPTVEEIYSYRNFVDNAIADFLSNLLSQEARRIFILGLQHEQQHQELLFTDIKYILGNNPLFPAYSEIAIENTSENMQAEPFQIAEGLYEVGSLEDAFCFDNELCRHKVYVNAFSIAPNLITNAEYLHFMTAGGYDNFRFWHADGWDWKNQNKISAPLYWHEIHGKWHHFTLGGLRLLDLSQPVTHINYYEASAFAASKGMRLPTEFEWEIASGRFSWGKRWEWTNSAYLPYPGFKTAPDATGEYNGKFMVNQMVLRGASVATPKDHSRNTYRNFFHPQLRWQFTGIRLAKSI